MNRYCTLFDSNYLSRGLAMYHSLAASGEEFTLYVFCFDDRVLRILREMALPGIVPVSLDEFETAPLLKVKGERSVAEYCWTCTPHVIRHALDAYGLPMVTYLDADLYFFASPAVLLDEFTRAGGSVLITEHRFVPGQERSLIRGRYCVQFITFKADPRGLEVLTWWQERCLEWCYDRLEDDKFGDQKYLDDWTERFAGVHVLEHQGGGVAPWNIGRYDIVEEKEVLCGIERDTGMKFPLVFYHFHFVKFHDNGHLDLGHHRLPVEVRRLLYKPYLTRLAELKKEIAGRYPGFDPQGTGSPGKSLYGRLVRLKRRLIGNYIKYGQYGRW